MVRTRIPHRKWGWILVCRKILDHGRAVVVRGDFGGGGEFPRGGCVDSGMVVVGVARAVALDTRSDA